MWDFPSNACKLLENYETPKKEDGEIDCYASEEEGEEGICLLYMAHFFYVIRICC